MLSQRGHWWLRSFRYLPGAAVKRGWGNLGAMSAAERREVLGGGWRHAQTVQLTRPGDRDAATTSFSSDEAAEAFVMRESRAALLEQRTPTLQLASDFYGAFDQNGRGRDDDEEEGDATEEEDALEMAAEASKDAETDVNFFVEYYTIQGLLPPGPLPPSLINSTDAPEQPQLQLKRLYAALFTQPLYTLRLRLLSEAVLSRLIVRHQLELACERGRRVKEEGIVVHRTAVDPLTFRVAGWGKEPIGEPGLEVRHAYQLWMRRQVEAGSAVLSDSLSEMLTGIAVLALTQPSHLSSLRSVLCLHDDVELIGNDIAVALSEIQRTCTREDAQATEFSLTALAAASQVVVVSCGLPTSAVTPHPLVVNLSGAAAERAPTLSFRSYLVLCCPPTSADGRRRLFTETAAGSPGSAFVAGCQQANSVHFPCLQRELRRAIASTADEGLVVYATRSANPIENEAVVASVLSSHQRGTHAIPGVTTVVCEDIHTWLQRQQNSSASAEGGAWQQQLELILSSSSSPSYLLRGLSHWEGVEGGAADQASDVAVPEVVAAVSQCACRVNPLALLTEGSEVDGIWFLVLLRVKRSSPRAPAASKAAITTNRPTPLATVLSSSSGASQWCCSPAAARWSRRHQYALRQAGWRVTPGVPVSRLGLNALAGTVYAPLLAAGVSGTSNPPETGIPSLTVPIPLLCELLRCGTVKQSVLLGKGRPQRRPEAWEALPAAVLALKPSAPASQRGRVVMLRPAVPPTPVGTAICPALLDELQQLVLFGEVCDNGDLVLASLSENKKAEGGATPGTAGGWRMRVRDALLYVSRSLHEESFIKQPSGGNVRRGGPQ